MTRTSSTIKQSRAPFSPEMELLLECARVPSVLAASRVDGAPGVDRLISILSRPLDWNDLFKRANRHGLLPLLCDRLMRLCRSFPTAVPPPVPKARLAALVSHYQGHALRNRVLRNELLALLAQFQKAGISALAYKGPALALQLYGDSDLRSFSDLDVLIDWKDLSRARVLVEARGFQSSVRIAPGMEDALRRSECDLLFRKAGGAISLELHWSPVPDYFSVPFATAELISRAVPLVLDGSTIEVPQPEDLLLLLCVNGAKDGWARLESIAAVAALLGAGPALDLEAVWARADALASGRMLLLGLFLAHELFDVALPVAVARRIAADGEVEALAKDAIRRLGESGAAGLKSQGQGQGQGQFQRLFALTRYRLRARERMRDRIRYCALRALTPTFADWGDLPLSPSLHFLHYLLRPLRLAGETRLRAYVRRKLATSSSSSIPVSDSLAGSQIDAK